LRISEHGLGVVCLKDEISVADDPLFPFLCLSVRPGAEIAAESESA